MAADSGARVAVVGAGRVGASLAAALTAAGETCALWTEGQGPAPAAIGRAAVVILAVPDRVIAAVGAELAAGGLLGAHAVVLHCAGGYAAAEALGGLAGRVRARGTLHPLRAFAAPVAPAALAGTAFGIEGDEEARVAARRICRQIGGRAVEVEAGRMPLYHAAAVLASNYVVALADAAAALLARAAPGADALAALVPLLESAVAGLRERGLPAALTGPLARGDAETVRRHLDAIARDAPEVLALYRACGLRAADVAARGGEADAVGLADARRALAGEEG
ncbi:MAG TPA: DUF2520 domain-containing protein [Polyangia bacterium]|jgi:predicted short-subunit dehydrogenase-like oxidoreductase (DUF2520 family)